MCSFIHRSSALPIGNWQDLIDILTDVPVCIAYANWRRMAAPDSPKYPNTPRFSPHTPCMRFSPYTPRTPVTPKFSPKSLVTANVPADCASQSEANETDETLLTEPDEDLKSSTCSHESMCGKCKCLLRNGGC